MTVTLDRTIRDIVAADYRAAAVFQRYNLDFCCKGTRTIEEACAEARIDAGEVLRGIEEAVAKPDPTTPDFDSWDLSSLVAHIVDKHHGYVRRQMPVLLTHTQRIAEVHGTRHPELRRVAATFQAVANEMSSHMMKEEMMLFPYIVELADAARVGSSRPDAPFGTVRNPVRMMEMEHESAGDAMAEIRRLTDGYAVPEDGCTTYRVCLQELEAFERDLHQHVHLENNILFPKAIALEHRA
jgi:regulator of cell morphogenesis and NO signaling